MNAENSEIEPVGQWSETGADVNTMFINGNKAYLGCDDRFIILDIANKSNPQKIGEMPVTWSVESIYVSGDYAYVARIDYPSKGSLMIVNTANPASPHLGMTYNTPGSAEDVYISGDYAYIADGRRGFKGGEYFQTLRAF